MSNASIIAATFLALLFSIAPTNAQNWEILSDKQRPAWSAIGKLVQGRLDADGFCTATLISPNHILTAAHCVVGARENRPSDLRQFSFLAGWNDDAAVASSSVAEVIIPESYQPGVRQNIDNINADWALVRLSERITEVDPLPITRLPGPWEPVYFVTYSHLNKQAPLLTKGCEHRVLDQGPLHINCPVRGGNSGAAVLVVALIIRRSLQ